MTDGEFLEWIAARLIRFDAQATNDTEYIVKLREIAKNMHEAQTFNMCGTGMTFQAMFMLMGLIGTGGDFTLRITNNPCRESGEVIMSRLREATIANYEARVRLNMQIIKAQEKEWQQP